MYSPLDSIDLNQSWSLDELSQEKAYMLAPSIAYLCVLMVVGVAGNALVLAVYYFRFNASTHRCFILVLAFYDFIACVVGAPWAVAESFYAFTYKEPVSCKIFRFILYYTCIASSLTLVLIAFERFRKICKPLKPQMTVHRAKRALFLVAGIISSLSASPALVMYGDATVQTGINDMNGTKCFISDEFEGTIWPTVFNVYLLILAFASTICMAACYIGIARQVSTMGKDKIMRRVAASEKSIDPISVDNELDSDVPSTDMAESSNTNSSANGGSTHKSYSLSNFHGTVTSKTSKFARKVFKRLSSKSGKKTLRITKMLTFVTVAFVISYLPHLLLMLMDMFTSKVDKHLLPTDNLYQILFYSFFLNNLVNPFIYASMDLKFRKEAKNFLKCKHN